MPKSATADFDGRPSRRMAIGIAEPVAILRDAPLRSGLPRMRSDYFTRFFAGDDMSVMQLFPDASLAFAGAWARTDSRLRGTCAGKNFIIRTRYRHDIYVG